MNYKFMWADGELDFWNGASHRFHFQALDDMIDKGLLPDQMPFNYVGGDFSVDNFHPEVVPLRISISWQGGNHPNIDQLRFLLQQELQKYEDRESSWNPLIAATVEMTEPEHNFGFMKEPHNNLYPSAFGDDEKMRPEANQMIKRRVLAQLAANHYDDADDWIYFTVFGSGASYNWDEDGDFDVQMWVDYELFNTAHPNGAMTSDDLVAEVRRVVQMINFPSFKELGLDTDECEGRMLIQYYPKPGKGTPEENLASKPYSCYDMETDEWLQKPRPITPQFYGEHFLMVHQKAVDIATQAEGLLSELERNTINWQFWTQMFNAFHNDKYQTQAEESLRNAEAEKEGVKTLFEGVFGGRQKAYSPEGEGIEDERDIIQKLLEVWGIFQRLKHFSRQPFPWEEQELPKEPDKESSFIKTARQIIDPQKKLAWNLFKKKDPMQNSKPIFSLPSLEKQREPTEPYSQWDFRVGPGSPQVPLTDKTRWSWTPDTGLHVWNVPENDYEIYHFNYGDQIPQGYEDMIDDNMPSGYLLPGDGVFAYPDRAWEDWQAPVLVDIESYLGRPIQYVTHTFGKPKDEQSTIQQLKNSFFKFADWSEIMENAQNIRLENGVQILSNGAQHVEGLVVSQSEPGVTYQTSFDREDPESSAITQWNCTCPWGEVSWGRTRQWKKYEGRPCKHLLAMYWDSLSTPVDEDRPEAQGQQQLFQPQQYQPPLVPGSPSAPPGTPPGVMPIAPTGVPAPPPPPPQSQITQPGQGGTVSLPGTFSKLKESESAFENTQTVRNRVPMIGITRDGDSLIVPARTRGTVLFSDDVETVAIFPLDEAGILEPHLVRVQEATENFVRAQGDPFVHRRSKLLHYR